MKIYKILNRLNGEFYVGKTIRSLESRMYSHRYLAQKDPKNSHLYNAMNKYGYDNFSIETICNVETLDELNDLEIKYIAELKPHYNKAPGGKGGREKGFKLTEKHKANIAKAHIGKKQSQEQINRAANNRARNWIFKNPEGNIIEIHNLAQFCKDHNLNQGHMVGLHNGRKSVLSHKGYTRV